MTNSESTGMACETGAAAVSGVTSQGALVQWNRMDTPEEAIRLINEWLADESGYDEEAWPVLKAGLERERKGSRSLFSE